MLFRSEEAVTQWRQEGGSAQGEVIQVPLLWELSQAWYHNRLSPEYRGRTAADVEAIFTSLGLTSPFWRARGDPAAPQK